VTRPTTTARPQVGSKGKQCCVFAFFSSFLLLDSLFSFLCGLTRLDAVERPVAVLGLFGLLVS
jgi:hypothetical protein